MQCGRTLLHYVADRGHGYYADVLLENGADANARDEVTNRCKGSSFCSESRYLNCVRVACR